MYAAVGAGKELLPELDDEDEEDLFGMPEEPTAARGRAPAGAAGPRAGLVDLHLTVEGEERLIG